MDISAAEMFGDGEERGLLQMLGNVDALPVDPFDNLLAGLYYFRLSRAAIAAQVDLHRPLLAFDDRYEPDLAVVSNQVSTRRQNGQSAWRLITDWIDAADEVNRQRAAIDRVGGLPVAGKVLREWIDRDSAAVGAEPPSVNQVRRRLGAWQRAQLRDELGPVMPPCVDLGSLLDDVGRVSRDLTPLLRPKTTEIVIQLIADRAAAETEALVDA